MLPEWLEQLDTTEKCIAYLRFVNREDLAKKFEETGHLYLTEFLYAGVLPVSWEGFNGDYIDFNV